MPDISGAPSQYAVRPCTTDDVPVVLRLAAAEEGRFSELPSRLTEGDVRDWLAGVRLDTDSWLATEAAGAPAGVAWFSREGEDLAVTFVIEDVERPGAREVLLPLAEEAATRVGLARMHVFAPPADAAAARLFSAHGFREVRRMYEMAIQLDAAPPPPALPDGLVLRGIAVEEARAFHDAVSEAFADHWEHHPRTFEEWWALRSGDPDFDLSLLFVVMDGDEVAGAIRSIPGRNGGVYVATLAVRRPWRGRGIARALLQHTFAEAVRRGMPRVTLGVDASSPTGATALYRSVGMTVELEFAVWERSLAG